jgi:oxygen-dependent protoporphyrinogen oxidase
MNDDSLSRRVAVIGGGITGLTAAWMLRQSGYKPVVFEKASRPGGSIGAFRSGDWLHELGPNSMLENSAVIAGFVEKLGLAKRRLYAADAARNRYIVRDGTLHAAPSSPLGFLRTRLFSMRAKVRLLGEPWRPPAPADAHESVATFVRRRLGPEFLDYAVNPLVGGIYAGDPDALSVRHAFPKLHALEQKHGSLLRGALKQRNTSGGPKGRMFSFPNGLSEVPNALAEKLGPALRLRTEVRALRPTASGWELDCASDDECWQENVAAVICALPAHAVSALRIETGCDPHTLAKLNTIEQPPVASVFLGFRREDVAYPLDGFGMLIPQKEHRSILGTLFSSTLFPRRAPHGHVALTTFVGGTRQPELAWLPPEKLVALVRTELRALLGADAVPVFTHVHRCDRAIPQYTMTYQKHLDAMTRAEAAAPGLYIGGNARDGISLSNCIASGRRLASAVIDHRPLRSDALVR